MKRILVILVLLIGIVGCDSNLDYSDFRTFTLDDPSEQLTQSEGTYYLYFYGPVCPACNSIKTEVLSTIRLLDNDVIYLVEATQLSDINENLDVTHTPTLVRIIDNQVDAYYEGATAILEVLETLS